MSHKVFSSLSLWSMTLSKHVWSALLPCSTKTNIQGSSNLKTSLVTQTLRVFPPPKSTITVSNSSQINLQILSLRFPTSVWFWKWSLASLTHMSVFFTYFQQYELFPTFAASESRLGLKESTILQCVARESSSSTSDMSPHSHSVNRTHTRSTLQEEKQLLQWWWPEYR